MIKTHKGESLVVQQIRSTTSASQTTTTVIPLDDTIPQNTEGVEISALNTTITPSSSTNILVIELTGFSDTNGFTVSTWGLFQDSTANALTAVRTGGGASNAGPLSVRYEMVAGTTSATTFKVRFGSHNGSYSSFWLKDEVRELYSTSKQGSLTITEYKV